MNVFRREDLFGFATIMGLLSPESKEFGFIRFSDDSHEYIPHNARMCSFDRDFRLGKFSLDVICYRFNKIILIAINIR